MAPVPHEALGHAQHARRFGYVVVFALTLLRAGTATAVCDVVAAASELAAARDAIDAACPCAAATKASDHVKCAKPVVAARVASGTLVKTCKSEALKHATKSICGRPGAVVCCGVKANGKTGHKIARTASKCVSRPTLTTCISVFPSVPTGCDATGCVAPVCGNGIIEPTETCDPPHAGVCDATCQLVTCEPPVTTCGNGTLEGGETCEPPGGGACTWDCQAASCAAPGAGEIGVACIAGEATVGAGARASDYLLAWSGLAYRTDTDVIARRFDVDGAPLDPASQVVSNGVPCGGDESRPAIGGNGNGYVLAWGGFGPAIEAPGLSYSALYARSYDGTATLGTLEELARKIPFGMCASSVTGPTTVTPVPLAGAETFAALWQDIGGCLGVQFHDPAGVLLDYTGGPPTETNIAIGYEPGPFPKNDSDGAATIASLADDTLAVWHAHIMNPSPPYVTNPFVSGAWLAADGTSTAFSISSRLSGIGTLRPTVAAASDRFLVAWAQGPVDDPTEIRAMRVTHAGGPLDADGGILLGATGGGAVVGGPVAAFDGTVWLVAWTEVGGGGNDLRAVAVETDGTVVDASPRLLASGLGDAAPAIASAGDGRSVVIYVRPDGGSSAVRAQLVPGT